MEFQKNMSTQEKLKTKTYAIGIRGGKELIVMMGDAQKDSLVEALTSKELKPKGGDVYQLGNALLRLGEVSYLIQK